MERALQEIAMLSNERFCCLLAGSIPPELGDLSILETLDLSWNNLTGEMADVLRKKPKRSPCFCAHVVREWHQVILGSWGTVSKQHMDEGASP